MSMCRKCRTRSGNCGRIGKTAKRIGRRTSVRIGGIIARMSEIISPPRRGQRGILAVAGRQRNVRDIVKLPGTNAGHWVTNLK